MTATLDQRPPAFAGRPIERLLTDPEALMPPARLGALAPSRLSASRALINLMVREQWRIRPVRFDVDDHGRGRAVYRVDTGRRVFDFMVFSFEPVLEGRTGRIIGTNWDMMGSLVEGAASEADLDRTEAEMPKLYAGRGTPGTLVWCRSNRSLRLFDHVIERLAAGQQPSVQELWDVGYLMRNTGLDGNGTFGTRSYLALEDDHPLRLPLHAQMLAAYLMREFSYDLVEHLARVQNPDAARLSPSLKRSLGLGNGSGLGLGFFINTHPALMERWLKLRQYAILAGATVPLSSGSAAAVHLADLLARAHRFYEEDPFTYRAFEDPGDIARGLAAAATRLEELLERGPTDGGALLESLHGVVSVETWEVVAAILPELAPETADAALAQGAASELLVRNPMQTIAELQDILRDEYGWALQIDMNAPGARHYVWYKSRDAEEPRRGPAVDVHEGRNWALDLPTEIQTLASALEGEPADLLVGEFLSRRPELRSVTERVQGLQGLRYHSPHMNMLAHDFRAVHLIRFMNAAFHGLDRTVDSLDRNVLGLLFQGAPTRDELTTSDGTDWIYPTRPIDGEA